MSKSIKILVAMLSISSILFCIGMFYNPPQILKFDVESKGYDKKDIEKNLEKLNLQEQEKMLKEISKNEKRMLDKVDDNDIIGDKILKTNEPEKNTLYIVFDKNDKNVDEIRKIIKEYNKDKNSYNYEIIYSNLEYSNLFGIDLYKNLTNKEIKSILDLPSYFLVGSDKKIKSSGLDYTKLPIKNVGGD